MRSKGKYPPGVFFRRVLQLDSVELHGDLFRVGVGRELQAEFESPDSIRLGRDIVRHRNLDPRWIDAERQRQRSLMIQVCVVVPAVSQAVVEAASIAPRDHEPLIEGCKLFGIAEFCVGDTWTD